MQEKARSAYGGYTEELSMVKSAYYHRVRRLVLEHYSGGEAECACCGVTYYPFLTLDHVENDGAEHKRKVGKGRSLYQWIVSHEFPDGFQVLCMNCNLAKQILGGECGCGYKAQHAKSGIDPLKEK